MENNNNDPNNSENEQFQDSDKDTNEFGRTEVDDTQMDIFIAPDDGSILLGRPYLTLFADTMSRVIVGWRLSMDMPPSVDRRSNNGCSKD